MNIPAITRDQMIEVDRLMIEDFRILLIQMMENAGRNLAEMALRILGRDVAGRRVVVLAGTGNNGGGGMVALRHLVNRGVETNVRLVGDRARLKDIPEHQWQILQKLDIPKAQPGDLEMADLIVDAIVGYGLKGDLWGEAAEWVSMVNRSGCPVLSLDVPSGLDSTRGLSGLVCIRANATLMLALPKTGLVTEQAREYVGDLYLADIGVPDALYRQMGLSVGSIFQKDTIIRMI